MSAPDKCCCGEQKPLKVKVKRQPHEQSGKTPCCCSKAIKKEPWMTGEIETDAGRIPVVSTALSPKDRFGACKARFGIGRMDYKIEPGVYAVGRPDGQSPVLVTANYKLTFDALRSQLNGLHLWILVLDTKGINVWCAAGKGTFGTKELVKRIAATKLSALVSHRTVILPQLGAPGVSAHEVTKQSGFKVVYGPVRASDIKAYLDCGLQATEEMRRVRFTMKDRLVLTPMELVPAIMPSLLLFGVLFLLNLFARYPFGTVDFYAYTGAILTGCFFTPVLLPFIPGRAFTFKGWLLGLLWTVAVILQNGGFTAFSPGFLKEIAYLLTLPSISAFCAMNFTGSSAYTSFSGVIKEMKTAIPAILISIAVGSILLLVGCFVHL